MLEYINKIYDYTYWADGRMLDACQALSLEELDAPTKNGYANLRTTLVHSLNGNWIWLSRWQGVSPKAPLNACDFPTLAVIRIRWQHEEQQTRAFLATLTESQLSTDLIYQNLKGVTSTLPLWQTLFQVVNHSTQHRSEIAFMLTTLNRSPGDLDMSLYFSQHSR